MKTAILVVLASAPAWAEPVRHVPPGEAQAGAPVELVVEVAPTTPALVAQVRSGGDPQFHAVEMVRRDDTHWVAVVRAEAPELQYYIEAGGAPVFATRDWPHTLSVHLTDAAERQSHDLLRSGGSRYRMHSSYEYVDFGKHTLADGSTFLDHYYRIDAYLDYRLWAYPLEEIRFGYTWLTGDTDQMCKPGEAICHAGFKVSGWGELGLGPVEGIQLDVRGIAFAAQDGFDLGTRIEARLGSRDASHVALGGEYLAEVGAAGYFRLGWATVPGTPMAATVEVTNMPDKRSAPGVRFYYDIAREIGGGVKVGVRVGYAARNQQVAGVTGGGGVTWDF